MAELLDRDPEHRRHCIFATNLRNYKAKISKPASVPPSAIKILHVSLRRATDAGASPEGLLENSGGRVAPVNGIDHEKREQLRRADQDQEPAQRAPDTSRIVELRIKDTGRNRCRRRLTSRGSHRARCLQ
jgi:hypothetical protein